MAKQTIPNPETLSNLLRYEPNTGKLFWLERPVSMFNEAPNRTAEHTCAQWNSRFRGKEALTQTGHSGHLYGKIMSIRMASHRVIWAIQTGNWPINTIDHIDRNPSNNKWSNLREATWSENARNCTSAKGSTSKFLGVSWNQRARKWRGGIRVNGDSVHLGYFHDEIEAAKAYDQAAKLYNGQFASLNF